MTRRLSGLWLVLVLLQPACNASATREHALEIHRAINARNEGEAVVLIQKYGWSDVRDEDGWSMLHAAMYWEEADVVQALIAAGADVNIRTEAGITPLDAMIGTDPTHPHPADVQEFKRKLIANRALIGFLEQRGATGDYFTRLRTAIIEFENSAEARNLDAIRAGILAR